MPTAFLTLVQNLGGRVVVITGASSELGRATAIELAGRGCKLVLATRDRAALVDIAENFDRLTTIVECDITRLDDVQKLADTAIQTHGQIDVWINHADITLYGFLEAAPLEEHERVIDTNLFGAIYCARVVVPIFRGQHHGTLINVGSVLGDVSEAYVPSYVISNTGVHGLTEALRVELADERDIHVCTIFPSAIPKTVAHAIAGLIARPHRARFVPRRIRLALVLHALMPRTTERLLLDTLRHSHTNIVELALWCVGRLVAIGAGNIAHRLRHLVEPHLELAHA